MTAVREHVYTATERRALLRSLAEDWDDTGEAVRELRLADLAHPSLPPSISDPCVCGKCLPCLWADYCDARHTAIGLETRDIPWEGWRTDEEWSEIVPREDRQDAAAEEAAMYAASVLDTLVNGGSKHDRG